MKKRGRPCEVKESISYMIHLRLRVGVDDDIIEFLDQIPQGKRPVSIKSALRSGGLLSDVCNDDIPDDDLADALDEMLL